MTCIYNSITFTLIKHKHYETHSQNHYTPRSCALLRAGFSCYCWDFNFTVMTNTSNIIVVDGHTYTWEWDADNLVLSSDERDIVFMMAALDFANDTRDRYEQGLHRWYKFRGGSIPYIDNDTIWAEQNDPDLIEDYVKKHKDTATVINNYED